jgi:hypothetical protein
MKPENKSAGYVKIFVIGPTDVIQGLPAREVPSVFLVVLSHVNTQASLRASGLTLTRMALSMGTPGGVIWRLLNGPTSDVWIDPMVSYLESLGVCPSCSLAVGLRVLILVVAGSLPHK